MIRLCKLFQWDAVDAIKEGPMAHEYRDNITRSLITENYNKRYKPPMTPWSHPEMYDPLNPPSGWSYDPYYEVWIKN